MLLAIFQRFCVFILISLLTLACNLSSDIKITAPVNGSVHASPPLEYTIEFTEPFPAEGVLSATLNGTNISSWFTLATDGLSATADGSNFSSLTVAGSNQFTVTSPFNASASFIYDTVGPEVHVKVAQQNGSSLAVEGYLEDSAGASTLAINGQTIPVLFGDVFVTTVPELPIMQFSATDSFGHQTSTYFARPGTNIADSVELKFTDAALAQFSNTVSGVINSLGTGLLNSIGLGGRPLIYSYSSGADATNVYLTSVTMGNTSVALTVDQVNADGTLDLDSSINNLVFGVEVEITIGGFFIGTYPGTISTSQMNFSGDITPAISADGSTAEMPLTNLILDMSAGFTYNVPSAPPGFTTIFDLLVAAVGQAIGDQLISQLVPDVLSAAMTPLIAFPLDLSTGSMNVTTQTESFGVNGASLDVVLSSSFTTTAPLPEVNPPMGSSYNPAPVPTIGGTTPGGLPYDLGLVLSANMLNQILLTSYESGLFAFSVDSYIDFTGTQLGALLTNNEINPTDNLRVVFTAKSSPFVKLGGIAGALGEMRVYDMDLEVFIRFAGTTEFSPAFKANVNFYAPFNMSASAEGNIDMGLDGTPRIKVNSTSLTGILVFGKPLIEGLLNLSMTQIMPDIFQSLASLPLPAMEAFSLSVVDIWAADNASHIAIGTNMNIGLPLPGPAPDTYLMGTTGEVMMEAPEVMKPKGELGKITILVGGENPTPGQLSFRYRVDNGLWSIWKPRDKITVENLLTGAHSLEVCSRTINKVEDPICPIMKIDVNEYGYVLPHYN